MEGNAIRLRRSPVRFLAHGRPCVPLTCHWSQRNRREPGGSHSVCILPPTPSGADGRLPIGREVTILPDGQRLESHYAVDHYLTPPNGRRSHQFRYLCVILPESSRPLKVHRRAQTRLASVALSFGSAVRLVACD